MLRSGSGMESKSHVVKLKALTCESFRDVNQLQQAAGVPMVVEQKGKAKIFSKCCKYIIPKIH
jgi:hypothetical protein